jgi:suppressor of ftsI
VNLRPYETVTFLVKQDMPGLRMFHCHILEHEDLGMMANLLVE